MTEVVEKQISRKEGMKCEECTNFVLAGIVCAHMRTESEKDKCLGTYHVL
jgi:hypothetical protein